MFQNSSVSRMDYINDDPSATDFSYALALFRRGITDEQVEQRIILERPNFQNHHGDSTMASKRTILINEKLIFSVCLILDH